MAAVERSRDGRSRKDGHAVGVDGAVIERPR